MSAMQHYQQILKNIRIVSTNCSMHTINWQLS